MIQRCLLPGDNVCGHPQQRGIAGADHAVQQDDSPAASWRRVVVADGIELHVRDDSPAARGDAVAAMREAVRAALGREDLR